MTHNLASRTAIRRAIATDIPFLATTQYEASLPPLNHCFWEDLLVGLGVSAQQWLEAMLRAKASNWGRVEDFWILEEEGKPVAAAAGYRPYAKDYWPLDVSQLTRIARDLGWSTQQAKDFRDRYCQLWGEDPQPAFLRPQADWIIETVAVIPSERGRGLGKTLVNAVLEQGRSLGYSQAGIMIINGNNVAQRTYEALGFQPYQTFYAEYFDHQFVGITKFRKSLRNEDLIKP